MNRSMISAVLLALCVAVFSGCATTYNPVSIWYSPATEARGGSGSVFLKVDSSRAEKNPGDQIRWAIGKQKDSDGMVTGEILSQRSEADMMLDAVKQELTAAGYRVELGPAMPPGVAKGLDLTTVQITVDETASIAKVEATGRVKVSLDVWKNGTVAKKLSYQSEVSDTAVVKRDNLPRDLIEKGLHGVLSQAVPDIVSVLEQKAGN
jgi:hypothetical protein